MPISGDSVLCFHRDSRLVRHFLNLLIFLFPSTNDILSQTPVGSKRNAGHCPESSRQTLEGAVREPPLHSTHWIPAFAGMTGTWRVGSGQKAIRHSLFPIHNSHF